MKNSPIHTATQSFGRRLTLAGLFALLVAGLSSASLQAADQTWTNAPADNLFSNPNNWVDLAVPGDTVITTNIDVATFDVETAGMPYLVNVDAAYSLGKLQFTSGAGNYVFSGSPLNLNGFSGNATDMSLGTVANITISNDLTCGAAFRNTSASASANGGTLTLGGSISLHSSVTNGTKTVAFTPNASSSFSSLIIVNGQIFTGGDITGTQTLGVTLNGSGRLVINNTNNNYTGNTLSAGGVLQLGNDNVLSTGTYIFGLGAIASDGATPRTLTNTWTTATNNALAFGSSTIGVTKAAGFGKVTLTGNGTLVKSAAGQVILSATPAIDAVLSGNIGENLPGIGIRIDNANTTCFLTLSGTNTYTGQTSLNRANVEVAYLANAGSPSSLGAATGTNAPILLGAAGPAKLVYIGAGNSSTDRQLVLNGNTTMTVEASGAGTVNFTGGVSNSAVTGRTLYLGGTSTGTISGPIANNTATGTITIIKTNAGTWVLSGNNSYLGATTINEGTLQVASLNSCDGTNASQPFSNLGAPTNLTTARITLGSGANTGKLVYTGAGETTARAIYPGGTTGGTVIDHSGAGLLKFTANFITPGAGSKTVTLQGSTAGTGEIAGVIRDQSAGVNTTSLLKAGTGSWTLSAANIYTGPTTVSAGTLLVNNITGTGTGTNTVTVQTNATLGGTGRIAGAVTFNDGSHAVFTNGASLTLSNALVINGTVDVHLNIPAGLSGVTNILLTNTIAGISGSFVSTPVIDSGSIAGGATATIVTTANTVELQVTAPPVTTVPTTTILATSGSPSFYGATVAFTATLQTNGVNATAAAGNYVFKVDGSPVATNALSGAQAGYSTSALTLGSRTITAEYTGDGTYDPSTNALAQVVNQGTAPNFNVPGISVSGGAVSMTASGAVGTPYSLWASTNVAASPITNTWTLLTNGTITVSPFTITDPQTNSRRFYLFSTP